jgi:hypothetical protein
MADLRSAKMMYLKAILFIVIGVIASAMLIIDDPHWRTALLLALAVWSFARAYYFAFYVIENYVDPTYRFAGLTSFLRYLIARRRSSGDGERRATRGEP